MNTYTIITDSGCDISKEKLTAWGVKELCLTFRFNDSDTDYKSGDMPIAAFYQQMRDGLVAKTSAVNYEAFHEAFEEELKAGRDVLYIGFSSGLSSTSESAQVAAKELAEEYPERKVIAIDTLCASAGEGMLVYLAAKMQAAMMVRRSRFFSQTPEPAFELYREAEIISDRPVPLPECMRMSAMVATAEAAHTMSRKMLRTFKEAPSSERFAHTVIQHSTRTGR